MCVCGGTWSEQSERVFLSCRVGSVSCMYDRLVILNMRACAHGNDKGETFACSIVQVKLVSIFILMIIYEYINMNTNEYK